MKLATRIKTALKVLRSGDGAWHSFWTQQGDKDRPSKPFAQVPAVFACVKANAEALGALPLMISSLDDQVIETGPMVDLARCPNPGMTGRVFVQHTSAMLDLFGVVHWVFELDPIGIPVAVYPVSSLQMRADINRATGEVTAWHYRPAGATVEVDLSPDQVHTITDSDFDDPHQPWKGLGPRAVLTRQINQLFKADLANEAILDNGVAPSGVFTTEDDLTNAQKKDIKYQINERSVGTRNRHKHLFLTGGLKWEAMGGNLHDMEFLDLKKQNWVEVCAAFRVPPPVVGIYTDSNYGHAEAAKQQWYEGGVLPRAERIAEEWTVGVLSRFKGDRSLAAQDSRRRGLGVRERSCGVLRELRRRAANQTLPFFAWMDTSGVGPIQRARLSLAEQAERWNRMGVPLNALTRAFDMPWEEFDHGETWYKPIGQVDVNEELSSDPPGSEDELPALPGPDDEPRGKSIEAKTDERTRAKLWELWRASWRGLEKAVERKVSRHFDELRRGTLDRLNQQGKKDASNRIQRDLIGTVLFDLVPANEGLVVKVGKLIRDAYRLGGEQSMLEAANAQGVDKPDVFNIEDPLVERRLRTRLIRVTETNKTLRKRLAKTLADGVAEGETINKLADRIRAEFKFAHSRAATIARTEVGAAVEESRHEGRRQAGVPLKSWLWSRKETGRASHGATEKATMSQPIPNDQPFTIAGTDITCDHPRDTTLPPKHSVNCGCTTLARFEGDSIKSVLARYTQRGFLTYEQLVKRDAQQIARN